MKKLNRFSVDRKIQKLADWIYVRECTSDIILDQRKEYSVETRNKLEAYAFNNDRLINRVLTVVEEMVKIEKVNQEIIIDLKKRIDVLEKKEK